jgi:hypothetical protein
LLHAAITSPETKNSNNHWNRRIGCLPFAGCLKCSARSPSE